MRTDVLTSYGVRHNFLPLNWRDSWDGQRRINGRLNFHQPCKSILTPTNPGFRSGNYAIHHLRFVAPAG